jgi:spore photoproduct lyase
MQDDMTRFNKACEQSPFSNLHETTKEFIKQKSISHSFSFSQIKQLIIASIDLQMWGLDVKNLWQDDGSKKSLDNFFKKYEKIRSLPKEYPFLKLPKQSNKPKFSSIDKNIIGFGKCPVASPNNRCCNLLTLDAVEGCVYGCSYCSIQTFYGGKVSIVKNFASKLSGIKLNKDEIYHIGTGQSSDSLAFGNEEGILEALLAFARENQNVILEFKSKSDNVKYLLKANLPPNIICTFSLNPQVVVDNEEHFTSSLNSRIRAAKSLSDKGVLVGFHFHPMIYFKGYEEEYGKIARELVKTFDPKSVALVSMGALTFTKSILKQIRKKADKSSILQMSLTAVGGKFSYPDKIKEQMFSCLHKVFEEWHEDVFFYLCMEDRSLWKRVFGFEYENNEAFEKAMKEAYMSKIKNFIRLANDAL